MRYQFYTLEKEMLLNKAPFASRLCLIEDAHGTKNEFIDRLKQYLDTDLDMLQLRIKDKTKKEILSLAQLASEILKGSHCRLIINDHLAIAQAVSADGIHLGQDDLPAEIAKKILEQNALIGGSTHNIEEIRIAEKSGDYDYIGFGPINSTASKPDHIKPLGEKVLATLPNTSLPVFLIGGICLEQLKNLKAPFPLRVAIGNDILKHSEPIKRIKAYLTFLREQQNALKKNS
jgi:thiamine-phosphate pyrophosphorylase